MLSRNHLNLTLEQGLNTRYIKTRNERLSAIYFKLEKACIAAESSILGSYSGENT